LAPDQALMVLVLNVLREGGFVVSSHDWPLVSVEVAGQVYTLGVGGHPRAVRELSQLLRRCEELVVGFDVVG
jgi:hypothetical protein